MSDLTDLKNSLSSLGILKPKKKKDQNNGYVYLIESEKEWFKIGISIDWKSRTQGIIGGMPFKAKVIHHQFVKDYKTCELELHHRFAKKRTGGEWFTLAPPDVDFIKNYLDKRKAKT
jgi:hypothetical protein